MIHDGFDKSLIIDKGVRSSWLTLATKSPGIFKLLELGQVMKIEKDAARFAG